MAAEDTGSVYVDVYPKADQFWARFRAQTSGDGAKVGDELGGQIGRAISASIAKAVRSGLADGTKGSPARESGRKSGEDFGGEFARVARSRIEAALKALPKAQIGASASEAEQTLRDLRERLLTLSGKTIGVDLDAGQALAEISDIRANLDRLGAESPNPQVRVDAARAVAQLDAVQAEVDRVDRANATVQVDADTSAARAEVSSLGDAGSSSNSRLALLITTGALIGPSIVPGAAAAAAAVAGIGPAAIAGVGAIGTVILAASGVAGVVKSLSQAQTQAAATGATLASRQNQVASSADQVRSAQAGLANTVANGADAQRRAAEQVANSERALAAAQREAKSAQDAINDARDEARRSLEDLNFQVADGALAQRRATLDLTRAEQELNTVRSSPTATQAQREQAQLAYDEAKQHITELGVRQQRLVEQQKDATAAGIEGSTQVRRAQQQAAAAQDRVAAAERAVADARAAQASQARQQAYSVAQAQQAVVNAQRSLQQALASTATAGGAAAAKLEQAFGDVSPAGARFAAFIFGLRAPMIAVRQVAEEGLLPGVQDGIEALLPTLPRATVYLREFSGELGSLAREGGQALAQPYWQGFFGLLAGEGTRALRTGGQAAGYFALGMSGIVRAVLPIGDDFGEGLLRFSREFAEYGLDLQNTQGYRDFVAYVRSEGPIVVETVGDVAQAAGTLVQAIAPLGGGSLALIRTLAEVINSLPVPVLTALAGGFVAVTTAQRALQLINPEVAGGQRLLTTVMDSARTSMAATSTEAGNLTRSIAGVRGGASSLISVMGGPWGVAFAAAGLALGALILQQEKQRQEMEGLKSSALSYAAALRDGVTPESVRAAEQILQQNSKLRGLVDATQQAGIAQEDLVRGLNGDQEMRRRVIDALNAQIQAEDDLIAKGVYGGQVEKSVIDGHLKRQQSLKDLRSAFEATNSTNAEANRLTSELAQRQKESADAANRLTPAERAVEQALATLSSTTATLTEKINAATTAYQAQWKAEIDATDAQEAQIRATDSMSATLANNKTQIELTGGSLDIHTAKTREQRTAILDNRDAIEQATKASVEQYNADIAAGVPMDEATRRHHARTDALIAEAHRGGVNQEQVKALVEEYGRVPGDVETNIRMNGLQDAYDNLRKLKAAQLALELGISPEEALGRMNRDAYQRAISGHAQGGPIQGPGGPTDDAVLIRASAGEFMQRAAAVDYYGTDLMHAINKMAIPRELMPGFAGGGEIQRPNFYGPTFHGGVSIGPATTWPLLIDVSKTQLPSSGGGVQPGGLGWSRMMSILHGPFPDLPLISGFRPGAITATGNRSYHSVGRAVDLPPRFDVFNWIHDHYPTSRELIFSPAGGRQIHNGQPHVYTGVTKRDHYNHVHWAYDQGGILPPGLTLAYNGTGKPETIRTAEQEARLWAGREKQPITININGSDASPHEIAAQVRAELAWETR